MIEMSIEEALRCADVNGESHAEMQSVSRTLAAEVRRLRAEVDRCHARLEIDVVYVGLGMKPRIVPMDERKSIPDGIDCRDGTIRLLEDELKEPCK